MFYSAFFDLPFELALNGRLIFSSEHPQGFPNPCGQSWIRSGCCRDVAASVFLLSHQHLGSSVVYHLTPLLLRIPSALEIKEYVTLLKEFCVILKNCLICPSPGFVFRLNLYPLITVYPCLLLFPPSYSLLIHVVPPPNTPSWLIFCGESPGKNLVGRALNSSLSWLLWGDPSGFCSLKSSLTFPWPVPQLLAASISCLCH